MGESTARKLEIELEWFNENIFLDSSVQDAENQFEDFKQNGLILEGNFEFDKWILLCDKDRMNKKTFTFIDVHDELLKVKLKCWLINLLTKFKVDHCHFSLRIIKEVMQLTNGFSEDKIRLLCEKLENLKGNHYNYMLFQTHNFLEYSDIESKELYLNELNNFSIDKDKQSRKLPDFKDTLIFDWIINDFFEKESSEELKLHYYPILIWWKLTNIIPMRANEFTSIKRNCLSNENGGYYITIPRKKQKGGFYKTKLEIIDKLEINKEMFEIIYKYIEKSNSFGETDTLLSYYLYTHYRKNEEIDGLSFGGTNRNPKWFNVANFSYLLKSFYDFIVEKKYGFENIERIKPMDTRHFAFCNLMLQGVNMLSIARMGGHRTLYAQTHYQNHLETFSESYVYQLTQLNKLRNANYIFNDFRQTETYDNLSNKANLLEIIGTEGYDFMEPIDDGYCTDRLMRCESDICLFCSKFFIKKEQLENPYVQNRLIELSSQYKNKINLTIKTMVHISKKMGFDFESELSLIPQEDTDLKHKAQELNLLMNQKAKIDSFLWDFNEENI